MDDRITMAHGAGGIIMNNFLKNYIVKYFAKDSGEVPLSALDDAAVINDIAFTSDAHAVKPLFFPGGDIGRLAISGTVNDLACMGAKPLALASALIIEEGFLLSDLEKIFQSMKDTCDESGVSIITGDTKVMEKDALDKLVIITSGIGVRSESLDSNLEEVNKKRRLKARWLLDTNLRLGDKIIVTGTIGDHGIALLSYREGYDFQTKLESDVMPLNNMVEKILKIGGIVKIKDPTRGGVSNTLNEWSEKSDIGIRIKESRIPIRDDVKIACEMLGIDPLEVGNEGKLVLAVIPEKVDEVLCELRKFEAGQKAEVIGEVIDVFHGVIMETLVGGDRIIPVPMGDPIPRIC